MLQDLEDDLRADVVREVADDGEGPVETSAKVQAEHIALDQAQVGMHFAQVGRRFRIQFHAGEVDVLPMHQVLGERTGARTDLDHVPVTAVVREGFTNALRDAVLLQEVLAEVLLGADEGHAVCSTSNKVRNAAKRPP